MEAQTLENIIKWRCIQVDDIDNPPCVDYHRVLQDEDQEELNGAYLVDHIVKESYHPVSTWK